MDSLDSEADWDTKQLPEHNVHRGLINFPIFFNLSVRVMAINKNNIVSLVLEQRIVDKTRGDLSKDVEEHSA